MRLEDGTIIAVLMAGGSGMIAAVSSHFNLSNRVGKQEALFSQHVENQRADTVERKEALVRIDQRQIDNA